MASIHLITLVLLLLYTRGSFSDKPTNIDVTDTQDESETLPNQQPPKPQYYNPPYDPKNPPDPLYTKSGTRLITLNELAAHGSSNGTLKPYWLAIMGRVYDVSKGDRHYGPNGGYGFFTGCDGTKAFISGDFTDEGLTDDVSELTPLQLLEVDNWVKFYDKDYTLVGKLIARFYDQNGSPTKEYYKYQRRLKEGQEMKQQRKALEVEFPPCNSRYTPAEGSFVSCSSKSGGVERGWVGLPRRYFLPGTKEWRCACVHEDKLNSPNVKMYPGCSATAIECAVLKDRLHEEL
jgi:predicted heme/steroid binding protein